MEVEKKGAISLTVLRNAMESHQVSPMALASMLKVEMEGLEAERREWAATLEKTEELKGLLVSGFIDDSTMGVDVKVAIGVESAFGDDDLPDLSETQIKEGLNDMAHFLRRVLESGK
ncbi:hypothetical protein RUND412_008032 [Rhizina undulata]